MRTMSPRVENGRTPTHTPSFARGPREAVVRDGLSAVRRFVSETWLIELLGFALAGLLVVVTSLCGLALVSTWVRTPYPPIARLTHAGQEVEADAWVVSGVTCCGVGRRSDGSDASCRARSVFRTQAGGAGSNGLEPDGATVEPKPCEEGIP